MNQRVGTRKGGYAERWGRMRVKAMGREGWDW